MQKKKLKEQLIYSGQGDVWESIQAEYNHIVATRKREEREAEAAEKKRRENLAETLNILFMGFLAVVLSGLIMWGTFEFIVYKMRN